MARWKGMTAEQLLIKREIDRINRQIRQAAAVFGTESGLYKHYLTLIAPHSKISFGHDMVRENAAGVIQLSVSKHSIIEFEQYTQYSMRLKMLGKVPTVQATRQQYIKAYEEKYETKVKTRSEQEKAITDIREELKGLFYDVGNALHEMYELEKEYGAKFVSHKEIAALSKGYRSCKADLQAMKKRLDAIIAGEDRAIIQNVLEGY